MRLKQFIEYVALLLSSAIALYFVYSSVQFTLVGRRDERRGTVVFTVSAFSVIAASAVLWFWALNRFVDDPAWYVKERLTMAIGLSLCLIGVIFSRFSARRVSVPLLMGGALVALTWIGSVIRN